MLRLAGSASKPSSRSGEDRWKKLSACDCMICARFIIRRSFSAVGGIVTDSRWSQALVGRQEVAHRADAAGARRQRRHLAVGPPFAELLEAAELREVEARVRTSPASSSCRVIRAWPSMRVTGSMVTVRLMVSVLGSWSRSGSVGAVAAVRRPVGARSCAEAGDRRWDSACGPRSARTGRTRWRPRCGGQPGTKTSTGTQSCTGRTGDRQLRHAGDRDHRVRRDVLAEGAVHHVGELERVAHRRHVAVDRAVAEAHQERAALAERRAPSPGRPRCSPSPRGCPRRRARAAPWRRPAGCTRCRPSWRARAGARRCRGTTCGSRSSRRARRWRR